MHLYLKSWQLGNIPYCYNREYYLNKLNLNFNLNKLSLNKLIFIFHLMAFFFSWEVQKIATINTILWWKLIAKYSYIGYSHIGEIIVYFRSIINAYSLLSYEWWVPLIKFMVEFIIHVRRGSMHLWYSKSI